jgi:hypothetical protein
MYTDGTLFIILAILLQMGAPQEGKFNLSNVMKLIHASVDTIKACFDTPKAKKVGLTVTLVLTFVGFEVWLNLFRVVPQPEFESDEEHFKYAPIGLAQQARLPLYAFEVMPQICSKYNEGKTDLSPFGFVYEGGHDFPIGLAKRQIGYPSVEPTCSLCHTGTYQATVNDSPIPILAGRVV